VPDIVRSAIAETTFVAFDLETTGLNPHADRIVEVAAVRFRGAEVLGTRSWLVHPGIPVPEDAREVHGIGDEMLADAPSFPPVYGEFLEFVKGSVLLAHNAPFDVGFLRAEAVRRGASLPDNPVLDTLPLARSWFPGQPSYRLGRLVESLSLPQGTYHRALADSEHLMHLFLCGLGRLPPHATVEDLLAVPGARIRF